MLFELILIILVSFYFIKRSSALDINIIYYFILLLPFIQFLKAITFPWGFLFWGTLREMLLLSIIFGFFLRNLFIKPIVVSNKLYPIIIYLLWGICLILITIVNRELYSALDGYRYFFLPWCLMLIIQIYISNGSSINLDILVKTIYKVTIIAVIIQWSEFIYLNIIQHVPEDIIYLKNKYPGLTHDHNESDFFKPFAWAKLMGINIYRGYGVFLQPQTTSVFLSMLAAFFYHFNSKSNLYINPFMKYLILTAPFITLGWLGILSFIFVVFYVLLKRGMFNKFLPFTLIMIFLSILIDYRFLYFVYYYISSNIVDTYLALMIIDINQFLDNSNLITYFVGHGFFAGERLKMVGQNSGSFSGETFVLRYIGQIGIIGILPMLYIIIKSLFLKNNLDQYLSDSFKGVVVVGLISTLHYAALRLTGLLEIFILSITILYFFNQQQKNNEEKALI